MMKKYKQAISACLCGVPCRYDGSVAANMTKEDRLLICPEILGGLPSPRVPVEIVGKVKNNSYDDLLAGRISIEDKNGNDYSQDFIDGANKTLILIKENNITEVILKANSPSCGYSKIYDGTFSGKLIDGMGICAALLYKHGIKVSVK